jgi:hypothetical protein
MTSGLKPCGEIRWRESLGFLASFRQNAAGDPGPLADPSHRDRLDRSLARGRFRATSVRGRHL